ncbi:hypothetical protein GCM10027359_06460 [Marilutibacter aestuarii]
MKCRQCGAVMRLGADAPGVFLGATLALVAIAGLAWWAGFAGAALFAAAAAVVAALACFVNVGDHRSMGNPPGPDGIAVPGRRCKACGAITPIRPWSL